MLTNYHSHTKWCRHGEGDVEDIVIEAIKRGYTEFAISEHVPYPKDFDDRRIRLNEMDEFISQIDLIKEKYKNEITILKGLECEYYPEYHDHYKDLKQKYDLDFLSLGQHFEDISMEKCFFNVSSEEDVLLYEKKLMAAIESSLFDFIVHPDLFLNDYDFTDQALKTSKNILEKCQNLNIPLEINANGIRYKRGYPSKDFWQLSKNYNITTIINSDCHYIHEIYDENMDLAYKMAKGLDIKITEKLNFDKK